MFERTYGGGDAVAPPRAAGPRGRETYDVRFAGGRHFRMYDDPGTFRVSRAGIALGNHLVRGLDGSESTVRILEIGTGSGAIAMLLRAMGFTSVVATDVCPAAVSTARRNERVNFGDSVIDFHQSDLFPRPASAPPELYDLIVFNPPGWRTPSDALRAQLESRQPSLNLEAMFYGDSVLLRFLRQLPDHLAPHGRAIVGLNSLLGIASIFAASQPPDRPPGAGLALRSQLLERLEFPLLFYTEEWLEARELLFAEFRQGRRDYAATYVTKGETIHWFYEITEVTVDALGTDRPPLQPLQPSRPV
ncbi:class I SAM-dependent methyltransferase [Streptomyces sp. NPDC001985]|uniref:class I SAM-dependent methyltransferase n=1 Tax=Streptomyces sp. NPDC001985 TaxID=3154406 RepID=UPI00331F9BC3